MARHIVTFADLVACARRTGVNVVSAPSSHRGRVGEMGTVIGTTCHWTGTGLSFNPSSDYPDYNVVKEGRAGLNNSLSAYGLGRYKSIYVFSEDVSWHAGNWSFGGTTDGNGHYLGIEAAGSGVWTPWQREVYPRLVASVHLFIDAPASMSPTHAMGAMPRGRKSDFPIDGGWAPSLPGGARKFHDAVTWLMRNSAYINVNYKGAPKPAPKPSPVEDDMPSADEVAELVVAKLMKADASPAAGNQPFQSVISQTWSELTQERESLALPGYKGRLSRFVMTTDRHVYQMNRVVLPWLVASVEAIAAALGVTLPEKPALMQPPAEPPAEA